MLVPEAALDKKEYTRVGIAVQGKKLHYHVQNKEIVMVCGDCTIVRVSLDKDNKTFSSEMFK